MNFNFNNSKKEKYIYFSVWILAVLYSLYSFASSSYYYFQYYTDKYDDFTSGFYYLLHRRDKSDFEWEATYYLIVNFSPWIILYIIISEFIRNLQLTTNKVLQIWQICFTILYLTQVGYVVVALILLQPTIFYITCNFYRNILVPWLCTGVSLIFITHCKQINSNGEFLQFLRLNDYELYFIILCLFWMNLKCTSYFLEKHSSKKLLDFLSFSLYPPTLFTGPFIPYKDYLNMYKSTTLPFQTRTQKLIFNLSRCLFWFLFTNFCLHYVYVNATLYQPKLVKTFNNWSLYGYGYAMGQFFHIKYIVLYGLSTSFASYENISTPHLPRCIGRIHLYSDMWKYFDPGLYNFLVRYIYVPMCKICHYKLIASFTCFLFVYLWHGVEHYILIWAILNYMGIVLEYVSSLLYKQYFEKKIVGTVDACWLRRIKCIIASPLLVLSAISNFYFFAGTEIGNIFVSRVFQETIISNIILLSVLYCCCQVSTELQSINANKM